VDYATRYTINREPAFAGVEEYLRLQGRFRQFGEPETEALKRSIEWQWQRLRGKVSLGAALPLPPDIPGHQLPPPEQTAQGSPSESPSGSPRRASE
jgi:hypothetical protein